MWLLVFGGIALAGLVMVGCFAVWLWRKATALLRETGVLLDRAGELVSLLDQIELPEPLEPRHAIGTDQRPVGRGRDPHEAWSGR